MKGHKDSCVMCHVSCVMCHAYLQDGRRALSVDCEGHAFLWHLDVRQLFDLLRQQVSGRAEIGFMRTGRWLVGRWAL